MSPKFLHLSTIFAGLSLTATALAGDFPLPQLPQATNPNFDLSGQAFGSVAGAMSYYDYVRQVVGKYMQDHAVAPYTGQPNDTVLEAGGGVSVKLSNGNYNIHVNYPNASTGGRSYGWTFGQVGDWSDKAYLDHLAGIMVEPNTGDLHLFYKLLVRMVGATDPNGLTASIESLAPATQRVAANFLAIYTAEAYRAMVQDPHMNWDDALFEVTMLGAFHGGQKQLTKYYLGQFTASAKLQAAGVYDNYSLLPGPIASVDKAGEMNDYWQFSANPTSRQSGVNQTRQDFEKMGRMITQYEKFVAHNPLVDKIEAVVGKGYTVKRDEHHNVMTDPYGHPMIDTSAENVVRGITQFFAKGRSHDVTKIEPLSTDVADLLMGIHADANAITQWIQAGSLLSVDDAAAASTEANTDAATAVGDTDAAADATATGTGATTINPGTPATSPGTPLTGPVTPSPLTPAPVTPGIPSSPAPIFPGPVVIPAVAGPL